MITILGASGFIGQHIIRKLRFSGRQFYAPGREEDIFSKNLGDVVYCIGVTSDFRTKPFQTVESHVCFLNKVLEHCEFDSLTYLSSTRVYIHNREDKVSETTALSVHIGDPDDLYNLTKLTGERLCLSSGRKIRIARISNVFSAETISNSFLYSIIKEIRNTGALKLNINPLSCKDYILIDDVVELILKIAKGGEGIYNLASGINTKVTDIVKALQAEIKEFSVIAYGAEEQIFPQICNDKIVSGFSYSPQALLPFIPQLLKSYSTHV